MPARHHEYVVAVSSLVVTATLSLVRPKVGRRQIQPAHAAIGFTEYALWMMLPAVVSILVTYAGLRIVFRSGFASPRRRCV